jgi:polar amino acid transport system permease protein
MLSAAAFSLTEMFRSADLTWPTALYLLGGVGETVLLVMGGMALGLLLGTVMASVQVYGPAWAGRLVGLYVWFFRGVPILVLMFLFFFGLSTQLEAAVFAVFGVRATVSEFACAVVVLGLCSTAYQSQIFRGAMQSIPAGQFKAALALGLSPAGAVRGVILPQALRISIPAWSNEYSIMLKDSAIAYVIGVSEVMSRFKAVASTNHKTLLMYILAGVVYYVLTAAGVRLLLKLYETVRIPGLADMDASQ